MGQKALIIVEMFRELTILFGVILRRENQDRYGGTTSVLGIWVMAYILKYLILN